jgi:amidase
MATDLDDLARLFDVLADPSRVAASLGRLRATVGAHGQSGAAGRASGAMDLVHASRFAHAVGWGAAQARPLAGAPVVIAVSFAHTLAATEPAVEAAVRRVAALLSDHGAAVSERPWTSISLEEFLPIWQWGIAQARHLLNVDKVSPPVRWLIETGRHVSAARAKATKLNLRASLDQWFAPVEVWISPTVCCTPPPLGLGDGDGEAAFRRVAPLGGFTAPYNVSGQPAISIPVGVDGNGLPVGVQLAGRIGDDALLLALAAWLAPRLGTLPPPPLCA